MECRRVDDFVVTSSTSVASEPMGVVPDVFALDAAFPNPFTAETRIPVDLPAPALVRLSVFDALGRLVSAAAEHVLPAGRHQLAFDGSSLPPGVYFGRVEAGAASRTVKLVRGN